ncbi:MAG: DNA alkylation repair protein [Clostridia bacterium]|nr:DNA alkylation repair protein [Clostridia bacterium]
MIENDTIQAMLFSLKDEEYRNFHCKLIPNVDREKVIGVRTPALRKLAKNLNGCKESETFLHSLPHKYYEENNLHAFLIEIEKDFHTCVDLVNEFLPYIDNWATCDSFFPVVFKKNRGLLIKEIYKWIASDHVYVKRFAIRQLMKLYLDNESFDPKYMNMVACQAGDDYYLNMMIAWYFATALVFQYEHAVRYLENNMLDKKIHNKTIQKAIESYRIDNQIKDYLRQLRK